MTDYGALCQECKAGTPVRFVNGEWAHEAIRTNPATRTSSHSMVYCLASDARIKDNQNG